MTLSSTLKTKAQGAPSDGAGSVEEGELKTETVEMPVWRKRSDCAGTPHQCRGSETGPRESEGGKRISTTTEVNEEAGPCSVGEEFSRIGIILQTFVPGFAEVAKPLMDLTKGKTLFIWGPVQQGSFEALKDSLPNAAVLAYSDYSLPFKIHPNACGYGIGAVLLQREDGAKKPLAFASRIPKDF